MPVDPYFTEKEMIFLHDQEFLLSKADIIRKIEELLGEVEQELAPCIKEYSFPERILVNSGKISKGDNYRGLPYNVLDFPRRFGKEGTFSFRTMFWWGNFFSATLHLSGQYFETRRNMLIGNVDKLISCDPFICVNSHPWEYHYGKDNYVKASKLGQDQLLLLLASMPFIKISYRWDLEEYKQLPKLVLTVFKNTLGLIAE